MSSLKKIKNKISDFYLKDDHKGGLDYINKILNKNEFKNNHDLLVDKAGLLYHEAIKHFNTKNELPDKQKKYLKEAISICKKILKINRINEKTKLNAGIFLAQIYACLKNKRAIDIAKNNFENGKNSITANRLADVYYRLGDKNKAEYWYKKYEKMAKKEKVLSKYVFLDMAVFYKKINKNYLANKYLKLLKNKISNMKEDKSLMKIAKNYFPKL